MQGRLLLYRGEAFDANSFYFSGVDIDHAFFLSEPRTLFVPRLNQTLAENLFKGKVISYSGISDIVAALGKRTLAIDGRALSVSAYKKLAATVKLRDVSDELLALRARKRKDEIENISKAAKLTKKILAELDLTLFKTENDVRKFLLMRTLELGLEPAFEPIVASNANSRFPHYQSGNNAKLRDMVLIDYGVKYKHYCSDLTRCFFLKHGTNAEKKYMVLRQIFKDIIDSFGDFSSGKELALFTEKLYKKYSLPLPPHSIGHGIGLDVHEFPRLSKKYSDVLKGTTMAIEPSAYFKNYGLRYEETIYFDGRNAGVL